MEFALSGEQQRIREAIAKLCTRFGDGLNPVVVFGTQEQKERMLPPLVRGEQRACFAVTEPDTGLNTRKIKTRAEKRGDKYLVSGQKVWISTAQVAEKVLLLTQADAGLTLFYTDLDRRHVEVREIEKMGRHAVDSNAVFFDALPVPAQDRPIGQNQAIQHPLAANWMALEAANLMTFKAAWLYDAGKSCGAVASPPQQAPYISPFVRLFGAIPSAFNDSR